MQLIQYVAGLLLVLAIIIVGFRFIVRRDYLRKGQLTPLSVATEWVIILSWVSFTYVFLPGDWPDSQAGRVFLLAGWPMFILGMLGMLFSLGWLGFRRSHGLEVDTLVRSGPYRLSRNPQIVSFGIGMAGFVLLWPSWHTFLSLLIYGLLAHTMVITEEEHLLALYGNRYRQYCKRAPRYFRFQNFQ